MCSIRLGIFSPCFSLTFLAIQTSTQSPILSLLAFSSCCSSPTKPLLIFFFSLLLCATPPYLNLHCLPSFFVAFSSHHSPLPQPVSSLILFLLALSKHRSQITTPHTLNLHPVFYPFSPCFFIVPTFHYLNLFPVSYPPPLHFFFTILSFI